ncbi:hypothetical protein E3E36_08990 [Thermococcus sp. M36]|uniref:hypothetical protein n=1 Tax=Thermococcus sp. M36 TaxID=1638261 RepID=UPI00143C674B|nr:hypothetical protein [Thermococcus sp. M36]NJE06274.1 hypothetical protein [Thermococcus sp. M36]
METLKPKIHAAIQQIRLKHLAIIWTMTILSSVIFSFHITSRDWSSILDAFKFSFGYFVLLVIYNPYSIEALIKNCIFRDIPSAQDINRITDTIEWAVTPRNFVVLAMFYIFFGAFIAYKKPVFWIIIALWNISAYLTQYAVKNCLSERYPKEITE